MSRIRPSWVSISLGVVVEAGAGWPNPPSVAAGIADWLGSWPVPFATLYAAEELFTAQQMPAAWASGLQERDGHWRPASSRM